jgi:hypothetical protein
MLVIACGSSFQTTTVTPGSDTVTLPAPQGSLGDYYSLDIKPSPGCAPTQVYLKQGNGLGNGQFNISNDFQYSPPPGQEVTIKVNMGDWVSKKPLQVTFSLGGPQGCTTDWGSITITWVGSD